MCQAFLVAKDELGFRSQIRTSFLQRGLHVIEAPDAIVALRRSHQRTLPVILLTGGSSEGRAVAAVRAVINYYLKGPVQANR